MDNLTALETAAEYQEKYIAALQEIAALKADKAELVAALDESLEWIEEGQDEMYYRCRAILEKHQEK